MNFLKSFIKAERDKSIKMYEKYVGPIPLKYGEDGRLIAAEGNTKLDAFRHAYTSGRIAMKFGEVTANLLGQGYEVNNEYDNYRASKAHKLTPEQLKAEKNMDLWNNRVGREIAKTCKTEEELAEKLAQALKEGKLITDPNATSDQYEHTYTIEDMFSSFDKTKVLKQDISNKERFLKMADHEANKGNPGVAEMYQNMARQQGLIEDFFKSMPGRASQSSDNDDEL